MNWKKWILALFVLLLTGCSQGDDQESENVFSVEPGQREIYEQAIAETLDSFYWKYDVNSILYFEETVPSRSDETKKELFEASLEAGFDLQKYAGKTAVVSTVNLIHFNGDLAGTAYFYFLKDNMIGVYYSSQDTPGRAYSLKSRNIYTENVEFAAYESEESMADFTERQSNFPVNGFCSVGENARGERLLAVIQGQTVSIYRYRNSMALWRQVTFGGEGNIPMSATFFREEGGQGDSLAVLLGSYIYTEENHDLEGYYISNKVAFLDEMMQKTGEELALGETNYTCLGADDGQLIMMNGQMLEYMQREGEMWIKEEEYPLKNGAVSFLETDLDDDGNKEYLMTDGMDFFVYKKNERGFHILWKTHLSIESLDGNIYAGDLNQDGIKEIYVSDKTGTMIRYVLSKNGLISRNDDIDYGQRLYPCDFDRNGKDDYIKINDAENNSQKLYIAK